MPWSREGLICNDEGDCFLPETADDDMLGAGVDTKV